MKASRYTYSKMLNIYQFSYLFLVYLKILPNGMSCSQTLHLMEPYLFPMDPSRPCWSPGSKPDQLT